MFVLIETIKIYHDYDDHHHHYYYQHQTKCVKKNNDQICVCVVYSLLFDNVNDVYCIVC